MAKRDYYEVLGVSKTASPEEIKSSYRKLARQFHPDMNREDPKAAEEKFKEVSEAYEVLADEDKRKRYDAGGFAGIEQDFGPGGFQWQNFHHSSDIEDLLGNSDFLRDLLQGSGLFVQGFGNGFMDPRAARRGRDMEAAISVTLADLVHGTSQEIELARSEPCTACKGNGSEKGTALETCPECGGSGQVRRQRQSGYTRMITVGVCPVCEGQGQRILKPCPECHGRGRKRVVRRLQIRIPPGLQEGSILRLGGEGEASANGRPGDLFVRVLIEAGGPFRREGRDIYGELNITLSQALLGDQVRVPTLGGHALLTIPPGTQPEATLRLRGEGLPSPGGGSRGDYMVQVHVRLPEALSPAQKDQIKALFGAPTGAEAPAEKARSGLFGRRRS